MSNIFLLPPELGDEDRFTACFHYAIDNIPELGQAIVDFLLIQSGKSSSRFIKAVNHPFFSLADRPDFLLECEDCEIICEHKIASDLGEKQLERYLSLHREKPFYVALITNSVCSVSSEVIATEHYLRPRASQLSHYCWQDFYPIVAERPERLAKEFAEYMRYLGMRSLTIKEWSDLFTNAETASAFKEQWIDVRSYFKQLGAHCYSDPSGVGIQVRNPLPWITLLYINVAQSIKPIDMRIEGPYLYALVYVPEDDLHVAAFRDIDITFNYEGGAIAVRWHKESVASWNKKVRLVCEYYTSLQGVLSTDIQVMRKRLFGFAIGVFIHVREVANL